MSKEFDYSKEPKRSRLYDFLRPLGKFICRCVYKVEYVGVENIPTDKGFILASNHIHALDPLIISMGIKNTQMHFMSKKELWSNGFAAFFLSLFNAFPVPRGSASASAFKYAVKILKNGFCLGIFPEGTRSKDGQIGKAKRGVADIAFNTSSGILPVSVCNSDNLKKHTRYTVRFGEYIPYENLGFSEEGTREEKMACAEKVMAEITALWEEGHCSK